mgnify:FL=1
MCAMRYEYCLSLVVSRCYLFTLDISAVTRLSSIRRVNTSRHIQHRTMAFPAHAIRLVAMQYRPNPPSRTSMRGATSDNEARIVRDERESFDDDAALERRVTQRITLKAKGREHEVARRRLRDLKMEAEEAERAIAKEGHRKGKHEGEGKEKHHTLHHAKEEQLEQLAKSFRSKKPNIRGKRNKQEK